MDFAELKDKISVLSGLLFRLDFAGIKRLLQVDSLFNEGKIVGNFSSMRNLFFHVDLNADTSSPLPLPPAPRDLPVEFSHNGKTLRTADWQKQRAVCAMVVLKDGNLVYENYFNGTGPDDLRISWSMSKSILSAALGTLNDQGLLPHFATRIGDIVPELKDSAYANATLRNVLNMASGVAFNEDYLDYHSDINRMGRTLAIGGSMDQFSADMKQQAWTPGRYSHYVSIDTHVLGMVVRAVSGRRTDDLIKENILEPLGIEKSPYMLTDSFNEPFVLGGMNMTTRDYARFGQLFAQGGMANGRRILSESWVAESTSQSAPPPSPEEEGTPHGEHGYGYQWWLPSAAEPGEYFAIGIYGQYIYVNTAAQVVVAVNSAHRQFDEGDGAMAQEAIALFRTISKSLQDG